MVLLLTSIRISLQQEKQQVVPGSAKPTASYIRVTTKYLLHIVHERIPLREWLGHMSLFHANVQICNDSTRTLLITMVLESRAFSRSNDEAIVPPHALEPVYSHLYFIPPQHAGASARVTITMTLDNNDADSANDTASSSSLYFTAATVCLLSSGDRLHVAESGASFL